MWPGYRTKRWRRLRKTILRRDGYRCLESARYGITAEATTVHHVWPAEEYPEYAWEPWNLISLTGELHNAMHDRRTDKLTVLGESWRLRISPPPRHGAEPPYGDRRAGAFPTAGLVAEGVQAQEDNSRACGGRGTRPGTPRLCVELLPPPHKSCVQAGHRSREG